MTGARAHPHFALWHGVTPSLLMSVAAVAGGVLLLALNRRMIALRDGMARPDGKAAFDAVTRAATGARRASPPPGSSCSAAAWPPYASA